MFEKRFAAVAPQLLTSSGTLQGQITVADASLYKVKQIISLQGTGVGPAQFQVQSIPNINTIFLGPLGASDIFARADVSAYTTGAGSFIFAIEQKRTTVPEQDIERNTYEEEPTVARRVVLVDKMGDKFDDNNPLPVNATVSVVVPPVTVDIDAMTPPTRPDPDNILVVGSEDGTKAGLKHALKIDSNGDAHVINMGALVPKEFDDIAITYGVVAGQKVATVVQYYVGGTGGTLVATLTLSYDGTADIINVART